MFLSEPAWHKKNLFLQAKIAEQSKRYDHMISFMKQIIKLTDPGKDLTPKERCLLGVAFRNFIAQLRDSLRIATATTLSWTDTFTAPLADSYLLKSKAEIHSVCTELLELIDRRLFPFSVSNESKVFYLTLKGDFSWYLAELKGEADGMGYVTVSKSAYMDAMAIVTQLNEMDPHRLALDFSIAEYFFKFLNSPEEALLSVQHALNVAAFSNPEKRPAVSLLSFQGGFQLVENIIKLKLKAQKGLRNLARISNVPASDVAGPSNEQVTDVAGPSNVPASDVAGPSNVKASDVAGLYNVPASDVAGPSNVPASDVAGLSNAPDRDVDGSYYALACDLVEPSNVPAIYVALPSNALASDVAGPSNVLASYIAENSNMPASDVAGPANAPASDETRPANTPASDVIEPANAPDSDVTEPSNVQSSDVAGPSNVPASDVASPANAPASGVASPTNVPASDAKESSNVPPSDVARNP